MNLQFPVLAVLLFLSTVLAVVSGYVNWRTEGPEWSRPFVALMAAVALWSLTYGVQMLFRSLDAQLFWEATQYVPGFLTPVVFFVFALSYAGYGRFLTRPRIVALSVLPVVSGVVVWVPGLRWLIRTGAGIVEYDTFVVAEVSFGPLFGVMLAYGYLFMVLGMAVLVVTTLRAPSVYRRQSALITAGAIVPVFGSVVSYLLDVTVIDLTPVALSVFGLSVVVALVRFQLLDLRPVAHAAVVEHVSDGILITDEERRIVEINTAAREMLGPDATVGTHLDDLDSAPIDIPTGMEPGATTEVFADGGAGEYIEINKSSLGGSRSGTDLHVLRDVTEQRARERWFRSLTEHSSDATLVLDADLDLKYVSPSVERILGHDPDRLAGESLLAYVHEEDAADLREAMLAGGSDPAETTFRAATADGDWRTLRAKSTDLREDPIVEGIVVNARDITESLARKRELVRQNERLDEFASVVSHDLRNPLSVAAGHLELVAEESDPEHVEAIRESHDRMEAIIDDVLTLARTGDTVGDPETLDVGAVARDAWEQVDTGEATLSAELNHRVDADESRLRQLFENLFRNAAEHGGDAVTVTVRSTPGGFAVDDDGPGIPEDERESVFRSGYSTADDGTGVGLAIVQTVAEGHDWEVEVTESPDGGARFRIRT